MTVRLAQITGLSAIAGGAFRIVDAFADQVMPGHTLDVLYAVTDVLLLGGVIGLWQRQRATLGVPGKLGLAVFVMGIVLIRLSAMHVAGLQYQLGAGIALIGLALYSVEALARMAAPEWAAVLWLLALALGLGVMIGATQVLIVLSGVSFGLGFVAMGARLVRT